MGIGRKEVDYVAGLARLELAPEEADALTGQLDRILGYVAKLAELNTDGVEPTARVLPMETALREDEVRDPLPTDEALAGAPDRKGDFFRVPRIIE